jgi:ribonuclease-3
VTSDISNTPAGGEEDHASLLAALGVEIEPSLLTLALTHRSYAY